MGKYLIFALVLYGVSLAGPFCSLLRADSSPQIKPADTFAVTLPAMQWQEVLGSLQDSGVVSAREAAAVSSQIQQQIGAQVKARKPK